NSQGATDFFGGRSIPDRSGGRILLIVQDFAWALLLRNMRGDEEAALPITRIWRICQRVSSCLALQLCRGPHPTMAPSIGCSRCSTSSAMNAWRFRVVRELKAIIVLDRSARLHIDPTVPHDWDQYFQLGPPGFDQRERPSYTNCHFYRDTHSRRDEWKKRVLLSPEHWHS